MAKAFLSGAVVGTVLAAGGLATLSVMETNRTNRLIEDIRAMANDPVVEDTTAELSAGPAAEPEPSPQIATPSPEAPPAQVDVAEPAEPEAAESTPVLDTQVAQSPTVKDVSVDAPTAPPETPDALEVAATDDTTPATANAPALAEPDVTSATAPEAPITPKPPVPQTEKVVAALSTPDLGDAPSLPKPPQAAAERATNTSPGLAAPNANADAAPDTTALQDKPTPEIGEAVASLPAPETPEAPEVPRLATDQTSDALATAPTAPTAPNSEQTLTVSTEPAARPPEVAEEDAPEVATEDAEDTPPATETAQAAPTETTLPRVRVRIPQLQTPSNDDGTVETATLNRASIGRPAGSFINRESQASRLPTIGQAAATTDTVPEPDTSDQSALPPVQRFAASANDANPDLPRMAIVLVDDGSGPMGPYALDNFPFPVTFAMDPAQPEAAQRMSAYRTLGYEVAALTRLPAGAQPVDVEQTLAGVLASLPEVVALVQDPGSDVQLDRSATEQIARFAADSGHGLVFLPNGLNTAEAIARRENVPTVSVLRDFDGDGQDARTKRRFLDGAAFRARQDGDVVMLGRLTPDTVSALLLWSLQDRASRVSMVPVSNILTQPTE